MERTEAIEVIRKNWPDSRYTSLREALETLIPELKESEESEEERVRKDIVGLIKFALNDGSAVSPGSHTTKEEAISWLEKQKEQKPAEWSEEDKQWLSKVYFVIDHSMYSEDERQAMKKYIDSLRSQSKTTEWSEEDEKMRKEIELVVSGVGITVAGMRSKMLRWLKSIRPSWRPSEDEECKNSK